MSCWCRWEWTELLGGTHYCKDDDTHEVVCIARLRFTLAWQVISAWGLRYNIPPALQSTVQLCLCSQAGADLIASQTQTVPQYPFVEMHVKYVIDPCAASAS